MMDKFEKAFDGAHGFRFDRFQFDEPDYEMLIVNDENEYLEHLRVQSAGLAYYSALSKQADREYEEFERRFKFRYNEMYTTCSDELARAGRKNNVKDIEAYVQVKYEAELKNSYKRLDELKSQKDYIAAFLEGWRQKSFLLSSMTNMITAGLMSPKETITEEEVEKNRKIFKEILEKRRKKKNG